MSGQSLQHVVVTLSHVGLLAAAIVTFDLEGASGLPAFAPLIFVGYAVHSLLPGRSGPSGLPAALDLRAPAFLALSLGGVFLQLGWDAPLLIAVSLALIGLAHAPGPSWVRIGLLLGAASGLAAVRAGYLRYDPLNAILPALASMFMFRLVLYLREPALGQVSWWTRLNYFFMLPNVLFPLFPVVDWAAFRKPPTTPLVVLHRRGVQWIWRGIVHLLCYRVVYHLLLPAPWSIDDAGSVLQWIFANYSLYLRVSGQFHLIVGVLLLFDFDLPETHRLYFAASSMNDYWRRVNVYWTSFLEKIVFYPAFLRLRRWGAPQPLVLAILLTFAATWALHAWQWFWLRGQLLLTGVDAAFWAMLGVALAVNSVWEARRPPEAKAAARVPTLPAMLGHALQTAAFFCFIALLWSFWNSDGALEWVHRIGLLGVQTSAWATFAAMLTLAVVAGVAAQAVATRPAAAAMRTALDPARSPGLTSALCLGLLALGAAPRATGEPLVVRQVRDAIATERLNEQDLMAQTRGYYEHLQPRASLTGELWRSGMEVPPDWRKITDPNFTNTVGWPIGYQLHANMDVSFNNARLTTNGWSMRDQDYTREKPPRTYRIALLGSSHVMGSGVADPEVFESMVEERLNAEFAGGNYDRYEILNFSCGGYTLASHVAVYEQRARQFDVDLIVVADHEVEGKRLVHQFATSPRLAASYPNEAIASLFAQLALDGLDAEAAERRLAPYKATLTGMLLHQLHEDAVADGAKLAWLYVPMTHQDKYKDEIYEARAELAREADMILLSIEDAYGDRPQHELALAPWDDHPNPAAHRLLADALFDELVEHDAELGLHLLPSEGRGSAPPRAPPRGP